MPPAPVSPGTRHSRVLLGGREISASRPGFVIAEIGVNHNGSAELAATMIRAAAAAGADAVKFQTFRAERLATADAPKAHYQKRSGGAESQREMLRRLELPEVSYPGLQRLAAKLGVLFLSTASDEESADFLSRLDVAGFKVGSGELVNLPFLAHLARKGKPVIVSTGMADLGETEAALTTLEREGDPPVVLLQCTSLYPCPAEAVNLRAMSTLRLAFGRPVGFSDHTEGIAVALAATALGACIIEKHFTVDRSLPGPDQAASLEPAELGELTAGIGQIRRALGNGLKRPAAAEVDTALVARKSVVTRRGVRAGTVLQREMLVLRRPGSGLPPAMLERVVGRRTRVEIAADSLLRWEDLE